VSWPNATETTLSQTYPPYITKAHGRLLLGSTNVDATNLVSENDGSFRPNVMDELYSIMQSNPFDAVYTYDPSEEFERIQEDMQDLRDQFDETDLSFPNMLAEVRGALDTSGYGDETELDAAVDAYEAASENEYLRRVGVLMGQVVDLNSGSSSATQISLGMLASDRYRDVAGYRAKLDLVFRQNKDAILLNALQNAVALKQLGLDMGRVIVSMSTDVNTRQILAFRERLQQDIEYDTAAVTWPLENLKAGAGLLAAMSGIPMVERRPSQLQSAFSNFLSVGPQIALSVGTATKSVPIGLASGVAGGLAAGFSAFL